MRIILVTILFTAIGCSSSSTTERFCDRADSCEILATSVGACLDTLDRALDDLSDRDRGEVEDILEECLDHPSCSGFSACIASLRIRDDGGASVLTEGKLASD
jgi:hypothetical protein